MPVALQAPLPHPSSHPPPPSHRIHAQRLNADRLKPALAFFIRSAFFDARATADAEAGAGEETAPHTTT